MNKSELMRELKRKDEEIRAARDALLGLITESRQWQDKCIGTMFLLSYMGCISEGRAAEILQASISDWRKMVRRVMERLEKSNDECIAQDKEERDLWVACAIPDGSKPQLVPSDNAEARRLAKRIKPK